MLPPPNPPPRHFSPNSSTWPDKLTAAERQVAILLGEGLANKEIAAALGRSLPTIRNHVAAILDKAETPTRGRFIALFHRTTLGPAFTSTVPFFHSRS